MSARLLVATTRAMRDVKAVPLPGAGMWMSPMYNDDVPAASEMQRQIAQQEQAGRIQ
jgi:hypothetical protein